jgi:hypothetical protein
MSNSSNLHLVGVVYLNLTLVYLNLKFKKSNRKTPPHISRAQK